MDIGADTGKKPYTLDRVVRLVITVACVVAGLWLFNYLKGVLVPFIVACIIAYMLNPFVEWHCKLLRLRGRVAATILTIVEMTVVVGLGLYFFIPYLYAECESMIVMFKEYATANFDVPYLPQSVHDFIVNTVDIDKLSSLLSRDEWINLFKEIKPQVCLMGASSIGRDLGPRVSSSLHSGLTADCTSLEIGDHTDAKTGTEYHNLLYQIRPAFGGNIVATIVNPECRPQMATVREGVMKKEIFDENYKGTAINLDANKYVSDTDFVVSIIDRHIEKSKINIKNAPIIVAGGYGVGSKENFQMLFQLAETLGAEVGASRAAVDAGFTEHERQIGQTGVTVHPKLYIACGISGQIQHIAGMQDSSIIISINNDPKAPINTIADYVITGDIEEVVPKLIKYYKKNSK